NAVMQAKQERKAEWDQFRANLPRYSNAARQRILAQKEHELDDRLEKRVQELFAQNQAELEAYRRQEGEKAEAERLASLDQGGVEFDQKWGTEIGAELEAEHGREALNALFETGAPPDPDLDHDAPKPQRPPTLAEAKQRAAYLKYRGRQQAAGEPPVSY